MRATKELVTSLYPIVKNSMDKNLSKFKKCVGTFIERRSKELYDICPCDRIYFSSQDSDEFFKAMSIEPTAITKILENTYYYKIPNFNPKAAKDEFTCTMLMVIRYLYLKKQTKELELATTYLAFSGKFYPSIHYGSFPKVQPSEHRYVMEYVVNNQLSNKFDLKREGSVFGAVRSICLTWLKSYESRLKDCDDEDAVYLIQQLHNRIKSFMKNIASIYYKTYADKDHYLTYDSDSLEDDSYRLADNDSLKIERIVDNTMQYINNSGVDYKICRVSSDTNVKVDEVKSIVETILMDKENIPEVKELITLLVSDYFVNSKTKDVRDIDFITYSIKPKPNAKEASIIREKEIIEKWLSESSPSYRKRRSRQATKSSYYKSLFTYFTLIIHNNNK